MDAKGWRVNAAFASGRIWWEKKRGEGKIALGAGAADCLRVMSMLEALIFDIGNVLLKFDWRVAYERLETKSDGFNEEGLATMERWKLHYEEGKLERELFVRQSMEALRFRGEAAEFTTIWAEIFTLNEPMAQFIESIQGRLPLYLLSNTNCIHIEHVLERYPIFQHFDDAIYSHEVKLAKPDPAIFELAAKRFGVAPENTAFIDDLLVNIKSAREVGFRGLHYDARDHRTVIAEIEALL